MVGDENYVDTGIYTPDLFCQHGPVQAESIEENACQQHIAAFYLCHVLRFARIAANGYVRSGNELPGIPSQVPELGSILIYTE